MPRDFSSSAGSFLDDLKARIGFGGNDDGYSRRGNDDDYDDYDDYDDDYDDYDIDEYVDDERAKPGAYRPATTPSRRNERDGAGPRLVSIEDVKERTRVPDRLTRDPLASDDRSSSTSGGRTVLDETIPPASSPAQKAALRDSRLRSEGLDSVFDSTSTGRSTSSYDPYEAYSSSTPSSHVPTRSMTVLKPVAYGDVERVAKAVKSGDVVVLVMRNTPDELSKRILDFSFGVASALDANVECPGEKVFAIARGNALSHEEKTRLRNQGAL